MKIEKKHLIIKIGAYIILTLGILIAAGLFLGAVILLVSTPDASIQRKVTAALLIVICSFVMALVSLSMFESMLELITVEDQLLELNDDHHLNSES